MKSPFCVPSSKKWSKVVGIFKLFSGTKTQERREEKAEEKRGGLEQSESGKKREDRASRHELQELEGAASSSKRLQKHHKTFEAKPGPRKINITHRNILLVREDEETGTHGMKRNKNISRQREKCVKEGVEREVQDDRKFKTPFHIPFFTPRKHISFLKSVSHERKQAKGHPVLFKYYYSSLMHFSLSLPHTFFATFPLKDCALS